MNKLWPIRRNYKSAEQFMLEQNIMFHNWLLAHLLKTESRDMLFGWTRRSIDFVPEWIALFQIGLKVNTNWKWSVWWLILGGQLCKKLEKRGKSEKFSNLTWRWYKMWQVVPPPSDITEHFCFFVDWKCYIPDIYQQYFDSNMFCIMEFYLKFKNQRYPGKLVNQY